MSPTGVILVNTLQHLHHLPALVILHLEAYVFGKARAGTRTCVVDTQPAERD